MIDKKRRINDILIKFMVDDWYSRDAATTDILNLIETSHFVHKCQDEICDLKAENKRLSEILTKSECKRSKGRR